MRIIHKILGWFNYRLITISSGSGIIMMDYGSTSYNVRWNRFTTIAKAGSKIYIGFMGNKFSSNNEKEDDCLMLVDVL